MSVDILLSKTTISIYSISQEEISVGSNENLMLTKSGVSAQYFTKD